MEENKPKKGKNVKRRRRRKKKMLNNLDILIK